MKCPRCSSDLIMPQLYCPFCEVRFIGCPSCLELVDVRELSCPKCRAPLPGVPPDEESPPSGEHSARVPYDESSGRIRMMELGDEPVVEPYPYLPEEMQEIAEKLDQVEERLITQAGAEPGVSSQDWGARGEPLVEGEPTYWGKLPWEMGKRSLKRTPMLAFTRISGAGALVLSLYYFLIASAILVLKGFLSAIFPTYTAQDTLEFGLLYGWLPNILFLVSIIVYVLSGVYLFVGIWAILNSTKRKTMRNR